MELKSNYFVTCIEMAKEANHTLLIYSSHNKYTDFQRLSYLKVQLLLCEEIMHQKLTNQDWRNNIRYLET